MDTIQISIVLSKNKIKGISNDDVQEIRRFINNIQSPYGYYYCNFLEFSSANNIVVKISYPRFYAGINAYLISKSGECAKVQNHFCLNIDSHELLYDAEIKLNRVDIPFTYIMDSKYDFNSYRKVFQVFNYIYKKKNRKSSPKAFSDIEEFKVETLIYADTINVASYNSKIMIYDQYNNIKVKTADEEDLYQLELQYRDLPTRMRIEVSKRIKRKGFSIKEFLDFDIFEEYSVKYKEYILENILDLNEVENFYNEKAREIANRLLEYREERSFFTYENFIYREIKHIYDYEIIRRALKLCIDNIKTREKAITSIRKVLRDYQLTENVVVMETYRIIKDIKEVIKNYF